jgi:hypothetical protein
VHWPFALQVPPAQFVPAATQSFEPALSQQPAPHVLPAQQLWPSPPHATHWLFLHVVPAAEQVLFAQHGWPGPPHAAHVEPVHVTPAAVH